MATIVLVHGIAQEQRSAAELETEWLPSLAGGLENAGHTPLADRLRDGAFTVRMAFYGNKFLSPDHQGLEPDPLTADEQSIAEQLALDLLRSAADSSNPKDAGEARRELAALTADPHDAQGIVKATAVRAAATLDRIPWFGRGTLDRRVRGQPHPRPGHPLPRRPRHPRLRDRPGQQAPHDPKPGW